MDVDVLDLQIGSLVREFSFRPSSSDNGVIGQVFIDRAYDLRKLRRYAELLDFVGGARTTGRRPLIVDAGANIGATAVYFIGQCPDALVIAIEPETGNFRLLVDNTRSLNVRALQCALAGERGRARVVDPGEGHWGYRTEPVNNGAFENTVECTTVNDIFAQYATDYFPLIVKIDIEGAEKDVFARNTEWVQKTPLIVVEIHDWMLPRQGTALPFLRCIAQYDRDFVHISENIFSISNSLMDLLPGG
jgi:FkbM family methyltransferase